MFAAGIIRPQRDRKDVVSRHLAIAASGQRVRGFGGTDPPPRSLEPSPRALRGSRLTSRPLRILAFSFGLGLLVVGRSRAGEPAYRPESTPEASAGRLGIGFAGELPTFDLQIPDTKTEAAGETVAKLGFSWMRDLWFGVPGAPEVPRVPAPVLDGLKEIQTAWFLGRVAFTPVGTLAGCVYGNLTGESESKLEGALPSITNTLFQLQIPDRFEPLMLALVHDKVPGLVVLTNRLPHEGVFPTPSLMASVAPMPTEWRAVGRARRDVRGFEGAEGAVLLRVVNWGLSGRDGHNPALSVSFLVKGTLVNARSRTRGRSFYVFYESPKRPFAAWGRNAGQPLREELWRGIESIAEQIAREIPPPPPAPGVLAGGGGGG